MKTQFITFRKDVFALKRDLYRWAEEKTDRYHEGILHIAQYHPNPNVRLLAVGILGRRRAFLDEVEAIAKNDKSGMVRAVASGWKNKYFDALHLFAHDFDTTFKLGDNFGRLNGKLEGVVGEIGKHGFNAELMRIGISKRALDNLGFDLKRHYSFEEGYGELVVNYQGEEVIAFGYKDPRLAVGPVVVISSPLAESLKVTLGDRIKLTKN